MRKRRNVPLPKGYMRILGVIMVLPKGYSWDQGELLMPTKQTKILIAFRASPEEHEKVDALAKATGRNYSQVLRRLVEQATLSGHSDLVLAGTDEGPDDAA
jgi:hypothetical protein